MFGRVGRLVRILGPGASNRLREVRGQLEERRETKHSRALSWRMG